MIDLDNRDHLRSLVAVATRMRDGAQNLRWKRAYDDLAHAASVLDAFNARSEIKVDAVAPNETSS